MALNWQTLKRTEQGFLVNWQEWHEAHANELAAEENITLNAMHWALIYFAREFYGHYQDTPPIRAMVKCLITEKQNNGNLPDPSSALLYSLFPEGPVKQLSKIAGLPKPGRCI